MFYDVVCPLFVFHSGFLNEGNLICLDTNGDKEKKCKTI